MAALASCTIRISFCVKNKPGANSPASSSNTPVSSKPSVSRSLATVSTMPEPHIPIGGCSRIVCIRSFPRSIHTLSIAPGILPQPQETPAPSNAGPAAVEVTYKKPSFQRATSPLVPMSHNRDTRSLHIPLDRTAQEISAPLCFRFCFFQYTRKCPFRPNLREIVYFTIKSIYNVKRTRRIFTR